MKKVLLAGCGGWGEQWIKYTLPRCERDGLIRVVGAMDIVPAHLELVKKNLGENRCYTDLRAAIEQTKPDLCVIAAPPAAHEAVAMTAMEYGCHVLSEKPVTDNLQSLFRLLKKAEEKGVKYGVTMTHQFKRHISTLRQEIFSGKYGSLDYLSCQVTIRQAKMSGRQNKLEHVMLNEASIHHFSLLESLAGSQCESIYTDVWSPEHAKDMRGGAQSLSVLKYVNGVRAGYEMSMASASSQHSWGNELIRAELEKAVLILDGYRLHCYLKSEKEPIPDLPGEGFGIPLIGSADDRWGNEKLLEQFVGWLEGGAAMDTRLENAARAQMMVFAAIESGRRGIPVNPGRLMEEYRKEFLKKGAENR